MVRQLHPEATQLAVRLEAAQGIVAHFALPTLLWGSAAPMHFHPSGAAYYVVGPGTQRGPAEEQTEVNGWRLPVDLPCLVLRAALKAGVAPTVQPTIYDVNRNGVSMYSTRPQIAADQTFGSAVPDGTYEARCLAQDDVLTIDCDPTGAGGTPAEDVTAKLTCLCYPHPFANVEAAAALTQVA
ncbi:MAG: hypothetical protein JW940_24765 [Polyangiaceae bacterium]|nr:hypothetical protein [Polyangiaceae bacterium]